MKHVIVSAFLLFLLNACGGNGSSHSLTSHPTVERITFSANAAFDGLDGGIQLSQFEAGSTDGPFKIYKTQVSLP